MPASVEGYLKEGYLATNTFIHKREIRKEVFPKYNEKNLFDWAIHTNRTVLTDNTRFNWFENSYLYGYGEIASSSASAYTTGTKVTVVLKSASHQDSGTKSPGKKWDEIMLSSTGNPRGWVESKNVDNDGAHSFVIKPVLGASVNITGGAVNALANKFIMFFSSAKADGTGMPSGQIRKPDLYYNYTQIIPTQFHTNGSESTNKIEYEVKGKPYFYLQGEEDAANKHNLDIQYAMFLGERYDGSLTDEEVDEPVYTTAGMDGTFRDFANPQQYTTFAISTVKSIEKIQSRERAPLKMMWLNGVDLDLDVNDTLVDYMTNTGIDYSDFGQGSGAQNMVDFGFNAFRYGSRTYYKKQEDFLNYLPVTGFTGSPFPTNGYIMPLDKIANPNTSDTNQPMLETVCVRYKANDRMNRYVKHWTRDVTITNIDKIEFNHMSEVGLQFALLNTCVRLYK